MRILYISINFPKENEGNNLYTDLAEELAKKHNITVVVTEDIENTRINKERGFNVLRVKTEKIYTNNLFEKAKAYIMLQSKLKKAIDNFLTHESFDLILFMAPPVTLTKVVRYAMKKYNAKSYLMQKDIFPQNALDLGILKKWNPAYWYFKNKEKSLYKTATIIGCMSNKNIEYLLEHNKFLKKEKLELFPNTIKIEKINKNVENSNIRRKYNIDEKSVIALYGGNFGRPQGIEFIIDVINEYRDDPKVTFIFIGKGTEKERLYNYIKNNKIRNVITINFISKIEYNDILKQVDIGMVFLDHKFSIPNIPSRTLSYFEYSIPIMAATDINTDYKNILVDEAKAGLWCKSNDVQDFKKQFDYLLKNKNERIKMGRKGRTYLEKNLTVEKSTEILEKTFYRLEKEGINNV